MTGASVEVVYLNGSEEPDFARPVSNEELVEAMEERLKAVRDDDRVDKPVTPNSPFGI